MDLVFLSILIPCVFWAFSPFTFRAIERYGFSVIVLSVGFMLVVMSLVLCSLCIILLTKSSTYDLLQGWFGGHELLQFLFGKAFISPILNDSLVG